jgi:hypothetical protein
MRGRILLGAAILLCLGTLASCAPHKPPEHDCPIEALVLDERAFPSGSRAARLLSPLPHAAWTSAGRTIDLPMGVANHHVYQFRTAELAVQEYSKRKKTQFAEDEHRGPWSTPSEIAYRSPLADQYCVACGQDWGLALCIMVARYDEYFVLVTAQMSEDGMTYGDLEKVFRAVDERMSGCLSRPLAPAATPSATQ